MKNEQKKNPVDAILATPANVAKDVATEQGAELATVAVAVPKTPLELADERKATARKAAKTACVNLYTGKAAELLKARTVTETNGKQYVSDFQFSYTDENGAAVTLSGKIPVTAVFSKDAAANIRKLAETVQNAVVPFHVADNDGKAKIRAAVEKDVNALFTFLSVPRTAKKSEVADILESAYMTNANGDYDSENENAIIASVSAIARRILKGRENAENADKARKDAASKAKKSKAA